MPNHPPPFDRLTASGIESSPNYQVRFASRIKKQAEIATGAVGLITHPKQAEEVLTNEEANVVILG